MELTPTQKENILIYNTLKVLLLTMDLRQIIENLTRNLSKEDASVLEERIKTVYSKNVLG